MRILAVVWGVLEATLFFIVPDVLLSLVAVNRPARALRVSCWTMAGALVGGAMMYGWGVQDSDRALAIVERLPAISEPMVQGVTVELQEQGLSSAVFGAWRGVPYKIYAVQAHATGHGLLPFLLISIPARWLRFFAVGALGAIIGRRLPKAWEPRKKRRLLLVLWIIFYTGFFSFMPN